MISEATVISKPSSRGIPFKGPPRPTDYMTKSTVIQVHYPFPDNTTLVNSELISLVQMIVNQVLREHY